jgi:hypothetical protein
MLQKPRLSNAVRHRVFLMAGGHTPGDLSDNRGVFETCRKMLFMLDLLKKWAVTQILRSDVLLMLWPDQFNPACEIGLIDQFTAPQTIFFQHNKRFS